MRKEAVMESTPQGVYGPCYGQKPRISNIQADPVISLHKPEFSSKT